MAKNFQLLRRRTFKLQNPLEVNPQLFREIKGKINGRNIFITSLISMLIQLFVVIFDLGQFPDLELTKQYSRYCTGLKSFGVIPTQYLCHDKLGIWEINWNLFWHDIFIFFSIISIFILLIPGTYMISADLVKEERTGTLNFIRLSPQSASSILLGKILGIPILIYFFIASILPLHFIAGLKANIPWYLILSFYIVVLVSCVFFYSCSLFFSFIGLGQIKLNPWIVTFIVSWFICITTVKFIDNTDIFFIDSTHIYNSLIEWSYLFNPIVFLTYTYHQDIGSIPSHLINQIDIIDSLGDLLFYGHTLWKQAITGMGFILFNYCLWTYWFWQGATRLFHNPTSTIFSKKQSYWLTGCFVTIALGFTLQTGQDVTILENFSLLQFLLLVMFLGLIAALSPHRQTLYDWARYRSQLSKGGKQLWKELIFGEKSPSTVAIALNAFIATIIIVIGLVLFPIQEEIVTAIWGLILTMEIIIFYAVIAQWMLLVKSNQRVIWACSTLLLLILIPPILFAVAEVSSNSFPLVWFFSFIPSVATENASISTLVLGVLGQWLAISFVSWQLIKKLSLVGRSETQQLLENIK